MDDDGESKMASGMIERDDPAIRAQRYDHNAGVKISMYEWASWLVWHMYHYDRDTVCITAFCEACNEGRVNFHDD